MTYLTGYFDESGKKEVDPIVVFCGFADSGWDTFLNEWNHLLRENNIPALHLSESSLQATDTILKMYRPFIQAIKKHVGKGFGVAVDVGGFSSLDQKFQKHLGGDPHFVAFRWVMRDITRYAMVIPNPTVSVVCDDDPRTACRCYEMFNRLRQNNKHPQYRAVLKSIAFADDTFFPQLQAADLLSWVARAESLHRWYGKNFSLRALYQEFIARSPEFRLSCEVQFATKDDLRKLNAKALSDLNQQET